MIIHVRTWIKNSVIASRNTTQRMTSEIRPMIGSTTFQGMAPKSLLTHLRCVAGRFTGVRGADLAGERFTGVSDVFPLVPGLLSGRF